MNIRPERLKELRRDVKEWSRKKLAAESKVSARQIARIESSPVSVTVRSTTAKRLARAFNVSEEVLSGNEPVDTARLTSMQRQAGKLGADADALSGNNPLSDKQLNLKIDSGVQFAYDLVEHCYPYSPGLKGIVNLAPLFFVLLAEGSLDWRKKCLEEIRRASDHLYETDNLMMRGKSATGRREIKRHFDTHAGFPHKAFCVATKSTRFSIRAAAHSRGVLMMGSSWALKEVLMRTGIPVRFSYTLRMS